jgi:hypothetical protein
MKKYYDFQPPTKTFEYVLSGMICIATSTYENKRLVSHVNGVLCKDNSESFYHALKTAFLRRKSFDYTKIVSSLKFYEWSNIVKNTLMPILEEK